MNEAVFPSKSEKITTGRDWQRVLPKADIAESPAPMKSG